jgi:hypothetical protein
MTADLLKTAAPPPEDWPKLVPLDAPNLPRLDLAHLPNWAGDYARAIAADTETPPELAAGMVLVACATAAARRLRVQVKPGYFEPCNLWAVVALPPGNRKSAVQSAATAPLIAWERDQATIMEPEIRRITSERKTLEARAKEKRSKAAKPGFRGRGLLGRFLYLLPPSPLGFRRLESIPVPDGVCDAYATGLRAMLDWEPATDEYGEEHPHLLRLSNDAYAEWHDFAQAIEVQMQPGRELEHFTDWAGKAPGAAARLAGVLHGIKHAHGTPWEAAITAETMIAALEIMAVITRHSLAALAMMGADPTIAAARLVWDWIERGRLDRFTVREAFNALRGTFPRVAKLREALEALEERGYLEVIEPPRDGPGRPPSPLVRVRPEIARSWR